MIDKDSYFDEYGLLHVKKGEYSENGSLFLAYYYSLMEKGYPHSASYDLLPFYACMRNGWFDPNPSHENDEYCHFSHDNMTSLYCYVLNPKKLPILKWNNRWWLHPRDILFYNLLKRRYLWALLLPLLFCMLLHSCLKPRDITSGKLLWWLRINTLIKRGIPTAKVIEKIMTYLIKRTHGSWDDVFSIYFKEDDHPIRLLSRRIYG